MEEEIYRLVDDNRDVMVKASFYGDPDVQRIMDLLYARWNGAGRKGVPLNYASDDELRVLFRKAVYYHRHPNVTYIGAIMTNKRQSVEKRGRLRRLVDLLRKMRII